MIGNDYDRWWEWYEENHLPKPAVTTAAFQTVLMPVHLQSLKRYILRVTIPHQQWSVYTKYLQIECLSVYDGFMIMMMMVMTMPAISICGASFKVLSGNKRAIFIFNLLASSRPAQYGSINNIKYQNILLATAHTQVTLISHRCYFHGKIWEPAESLVTLATTLLMWPWWAG